MIRLHELKLALEDDPHGLEPLVCSTLQVQRADLASMVVFIRSVDARKSDLLVVYVVDVVLHDAALERSLLARQAPAARVMRAPEPRSYL